MPFEPPSKLTRQICSICPIVGCAEDRRESDTGNFISCGRIGEIGDETEKEHDECYITYTSLTFINKFRLSSKFQEVK